MREAGAGEAGRALGRKEHHEQHGALLAESQMNVSGLGDEQHRQRHIYGRAVGVEREDGRQHQPDDFLRATHVL